MHVLSCLILTVLCYDLFCYIHFTDNKTEIQRDEGTSPKSCSKWLTADGSPGFQIPDLVTFLFPTLPWHCTEGHNVKTSALALLTSFEERDSAQLAPCLPSQEKEEMEGSGMVLGRWLLPNPLFVLWPLKESSLAYTSRMALILIHIKAFCFLLDVLRLLCFSLGQLTRPGWRPFSLHCQTQFTYISHFPELNGHNLGKHTQTLMHFFIYC